MLETLPAPDLQPPAASALRFETVCALVIDDDAAQRLLLTHMLKALSVQQVYQAADGMAGLRLLPSVRPDVIICDIMMAPANGYTFLRTLRRDATRPADRTPVVMISGVESPGSVMKARCLEADAYLRKPFRTDALGEAITRAMHPRGVGTAFSIARPEPAA